MRNKPRKDVACRVCAKTFNVLKSSLRRLANAERKYRCAWCATRGKGKNPNLPTPPSRSYVGVSCGCGRTGKVRADYLKDLEKRGRNYYCKSCASLGYFSESPLPKSGDKIAQICRKCGAEHEIAQRKVRTLEARKEKYRCWDCVPKFTSKGELELSKFISSLGIVDISNNVRSILPGMELDIYLPKYKIGIEYNGNYWHSIEKKPGKNYHLNKRLAAETLGIRLIQIRDDEWTRKRPIVESILKYSVGVGVDVTHARKLVVGKVEQRTAQNFLNRNHLMGVHQSSRALGLFTKTGELLQMLSYRLLSGKTILELSRVCGKINCSIVGGVSRLIAHVRRLHSGILKVVSFVDLRYATGSSLIKLGFKQVGVTLGFGWTKGLEVFNRRMCRANMNKQRLTEKQWASKLNLVKIFDAGQAKFEWEV